MSKKQLLIQAIIFIIYAFLSLIVFSIINEGIHLMLAWNAFLAFIPLLLIFLFNRYSERRYIGIILFLAWLFFYPNSLYMVTDLIYLKQDSFIEDLGMYQGLLYLQDFKAYLGYFHILLGALYGLMMAYISFKFFYHYINKHFEKKIYIRSYYILLPILVSIAIYIGRFLRFNSWDVFRPWLIVIDFFNDISIFTLFYILMFTLLQYIVFGFYILHKKRMI